MVNFGIDLELMFQQYNYQPYRLRCTKLIELLMLLPRLFQNYIG